MNDTEYIGYISSNNFIFFKKGIARNRTMLYNTITNLIFAFSETDVLEMIRKIDPAIGASIYRL